MWAEGPFNVVRAESIYPHSPSAPETYVKKVKPRDSWQSGEADSVPRGGPLQLNLAVRLS